jgi:hypothetical protein
MIVSTVDQSGCDPGPLQDCLANLIGQDEIRANQIERQNCNALPAIIQHQRARMQVVMNAGAALNGSERRRSREGGNDSLCRTGLHVCHPHLERLYI